MKKRIYKKCVPRVRIGVTFPGLSAAMEEAT